MASKKLKPVDVVMVGAGLVGTVIVKELAATGLKVVGLIASSLVRHEDLESSCNRVMHGA